MSKPRQPLDLDFSPAPPPASKADEVLAGLKAFLRDEIVPGLDEVSTLWQVAERGHPVDAFRLGRCASQLRMRIDTELPLAQWLLDVSWANALGDEHRSNKTAQTTHRAGVNAKVVEAEAKADIADLQQLVTVLKNHQAGLIRDANFAQSLLRGFTERESQTSFEA